MSHTYLLGSTIRLLYLLVWVAAPAYVVWQASGGIPLSATTWRLLALGLIGYYLAQWLHLLCDGIVPFAPKKRPKRRVRS